MALRFTKKEKVTNVTTFFGIKWVIGQVLGARHCVA